MSSHASQVLPQTSMDPMVYERQAEMCKAFANPTRLRLLDLLSEKEWACGDLQERLSITKANLSQHISVLKRAGVVVTRRDGKKMFCSLSIPEVEQACRLLRQVLLVRMKAGF